MTKMAKIIEIINILFVPIISIFSLTILWSLIYLFRKIYSIEKLDLNQMEIMESVEKKYGKKYPLADDYFKIIHYPRYYSFFNQFKDYKYLIKKNFNNISSTCCFTQIKNDIYYICDLKKIGLEKNQTVYFIVYGYLFLRIRKMFGIVMESNPTIKYLSEKFNFIKPFEFNLYKIKFSILKENQQILNEIFPNFYIVEGYKKFILESNNEELICYHIAQPIDILLVKEQKPITFDKINDSDDIMFCIDSKSNLNQLLFRNDIYFINKMSIIANKDFTKEFDFNLIKTYMI
jgi:hypothetical protein